MKNFIRLFTILLPIFVSSYAHALVELRASYGTLTSSPDLAALYSGTSSDIPGITPTLGVGADVIVSPPLFPLGFGLRYESQSLEVQNALLKYEANFSRTSLVMNWRLINTLLFVGPIFTYGLSDSTNLKITSPSLGVLSNWSAGSTSSYSIGLEAGVKLLTFLLGAEIGIMDYRWKDASDATGNITTKRDINMSGNYLKMHLGFAI